MSLTKKITKQLKNALSPYMLLNIFGPMGIMAGSALSYTDNKNKKEIKNAKKDQEIELVSAMVDKKRKDQEFGQRVESNRKKSARTQTVFAGMLNKNQHIGLGGQKTLLGI